MVSVDQLLLPPAYGESDTEHLPVEQEVLRHIAKQRILLLGVPGAGKTTLAETLHNREGSIKYISLGDISRQLPPDSPERNYLDELFATGGPVGDPNFFLDLVEPHIDACIDNGTGFILDGIPKKKEEITPLLEFMKTKGIAIDTVISCEIDPREAHSRISGRNQRGGDRDTMGIFLNRTNVYLNDLPDFKAALSNTGATIFTINTDKLSQEEAADHLLASYALLHSSPPRKLDIVSVTENIQMGEFTNAAGQLASIFDDNFEGLPYGDIFSDKVDYGYKKSLIKEALWNRDPQLREMPLMTDRLVDNYFATTVASITHLVKSLAEELHATGKQEFAEQDVQHLLQEQLATRDLIVGLQKELIDGRDFEEIVSQEVDNNREELKHISSKLQQIAKEKGYPRTNLDPETIMRLQPVLWNQLTSSTVLFAPDTNYRRTANGVPGSHHSLLPLSRANRFLAANSMADYLPFIEAVSSSDYKYSSTFGFMHLIGINKTGEAYGIEYPIMMHDKRLLDLESKRLNDLLQHIDSFYSTHDIWHNIIPVYADHFILHHPDAPLSYGGRRDAYLDFGRKMRLDKEEYEIGVAAAHAKTQQERFDATPTIREQQVGIVMSVLDELPILREELKSQIDEVEVNDVLDFLSSRVASNLFNILPPEDGIYDIVDEKLKALNLPPLEVAIDSVVELVVRQHLVDVCRFPQLDTTELIRAATEDHQLAHAILDAIDPTLPHRESGSEFLVKALEDFGVLGAASSREDTYYLDGMHRVRWIAMMAPQRQQLKGHMEKVHGKDGSYKYGDVLLDDARELVHLQQQALQPDMPHYLYRIQARRENQQISYSAYSVCFDDAQDLNTEARQELKYLLGHDNPSAIYMAHSLIQSLDRLIDSLVKSTYTFSEQEGLDLLDQAKTLREAGYTDLPDTLVNIAERYIHLRRDEIQYQHSLGISYPEAAQKIIDDQMSIA